MHPIKMDLHQLQQLLSPRKHDAHKGDFGTVLIVGGAPGMMGAPLMAAMAAQRVGAGKVIIATHPMHAENMAINQPSIMSYGIDNSEILLNLLSQATHIVLGPGLSQTEWALTLFRHALKANRPMIVDADALNLLSLYPSEYDNWILTPHVGEAARLLKQTPADIQAQRAAAAIALQKKYHGIVVLKGAGSLIASESSLHLCELGNPGMATAGMGDILSGVIAGLAAQNLSLLQAAQLGVEIHARAGDLAAQQGMRGLIATDLLPYLRTLVNP